MRFVLFCVFAFLCSGILSGQQNRWNKRSGSPSFGSDDEGSPFMIELHIGSPIGLGIALNYHTPFLSNRIRPYVAYGILQLGLDPSNFSNNVTKFEVNNVAVDISCSNLALHNGMNTDIEIIFKSSTLEVGTLIFFSSKGHGLYLNMGLDFMNAEFDFLNAPFIDELNNIEKKTFSQKQFITTFNTSIGYQTGGRLYVKGEAGIGIIATLPDTFEYDNSYSRNGYDVTQETMISYPKLPGEILGGKLITGRIAVGYRF